ncbi:hypothetical protein [Nocardioides pinisoli]|uniref:Calcium-binding protein n=1 Tax=Nocardioides pinisoli TaxID=2950279 RepID=A0ABT1KRU4_9ACTN|nr:hypothetical protein [Nocardioides pinisoli]MCP3420463.1 hypothetical protein [Nocardioides pinisoli]
MRPHLPIGLATGLIAATLLSNAPAQAAAETCQGRPATIVGSYLQREVVGTEGADVVVTNGAIEVDTRGGDDLVCVTESEGRYPDLSLATGAGDDVVDASGSRGSVGVELGAGSDHYTGSAGGGDWVVAGGEGRDTEPDTIHTGAGTLVDSVVSGSPGVPNGDVVVVEAGGTVYWSGPMTEGARLDATAGPGSTLVPDLGTGHAVVDATAGTLERDGFVTLRWTGFDGFAFSGTRAPSAFRFDGSDRDETVYVSFPTRVHDRQRFYLGGGDDTLLSPDGAGGSRSRYVGGDGDDRVDLWAGRRLDLDLASGTMTMRQDGTIARSRFTGFETSLLGAKDLRVRGTKGADELRFYACRATVRGRAGKDDIASARTADDADLLGCDARTSRIRIYGDAGRDTLRGSRGRDLLVGGPGRDTINGNANRDTCSGEKLRSCEVRLR